MTNISVKKKSRRTCFALEQLAVPILVALLVNVSRAQISTVQSEENMDSKAFSSVVAQFSAKFCNELEKDKSVVSSPLSAEFVLALLTLGSTDSVHSELLTALGIPNDDSIRSSFTEVSSKLKSIKGVTLNVANKVYIKEGDYDLNPQLKEDAVKVFDAGFEKLDFSNAVAAADTINKWVESKTNDRIKDLLSPDSFSDLTRLVLVNALYFKGTWKKQFDARRTAPYPFHVSESKIIDVPMMFNEDNFSYGESEELKAQLLQMHYIGDETSLIIVLPNEINGLDEVLQKLADGHDLMDDIQKMYNTKVNVIIPKFKIETEIDLTELLPKLGIKEIFDQSNTGLCKLLNTEEPLFVATAVQKAFIEVNEEGAEAAAATVMGIAFCSAILDLDPVRNFTADRPFLAVIFVEHTPYFFTTYRGEE